MTTPDTSPVSALELNDGFTLGELHVAFAETPYGLRLAENVRFGPYKPDHFDNARWEELLGDDVNNLRHMELSVWQTETFLAGCAEPPLAWDGEVPDHARFTAEERRILLLTAAVHDWPEGATEKGDVLFHLKDDADEAEEATAMERMFTELLPEDRHPGIIAGSVAQIGEILEKGNHETHKLSRAFNAIERSGYLITAMRSYDLSRLSEQDEVTRAHLAVLARDVLNNQIDPMEQYATEYPPVAQLMARYHPRVIEAFLELNPDMRIRELPSPANVAETFRETRDRYLTRHSVDATPLYP